MGRGNRTTPEFRREAVRLALMVDEDERKLRMISALACHR